MVIFDWIESNIMSFLSLQGAVSQGIIWGIMAIGVYLTYRILDFADLSVEGTLGLGAGVSAILIINGMNPYLTLVFSLLAGALAGFATGIFNTVFKIPPILSGILTMIGLYSITIRVMGDSANVTLIGKDKVITPISELLKKCGLSGTAVENIAGIILGIVFVVAVIVLLYRFFGTEIGTSIRATGSNVKMSRALGVNTDAMVVLTLVISNALVGLCGGLLAQTQGTADVQVGQGSIVIGLASIIIGEVIMCHKDHSFGYKLSAVVVGSIIYRIIFSLAIAPLGQKIGLKSFDTKIITAVIIAVALAVPVVKSKLNHRKLRIANDKRYENIGGGVNA